MTYPHGDPETPSKQRESYGDLAPIVLPLLPGEALVKARDTAEELGWEILATDSADGRIEATETSTLFRFVDDIAIRIRANPEGGGSTVDLRSTSRDGVSDLGANAERIRAFRDAMTGS